MTVLWDATTMIPKLVGKIGYEVHPQAMRQWKAREAGAIKEYKLRGRQNNIIVDNGANDTGGHIADGAPTNFSSDAPVEAQYYTKVYYLGVEIGRQAADETKDIDRGVDLFQNAWKRAMKTAGKQLATCFYGDPLFTFTATLAAGSTSFNVKDSNRFEPGAKYDVYRSGTKIETINVTDVVHVGGLTDDKAITIEATSNEFLANDTVELQGKANQPNSMVDVCGTSSLFGVAATTKNWKGTTDDFGGTFSKGKLEDLEDQRYEASEVDADVIFCSKKIQRLLHREESDKIRFTPGSNLDGVKSMTLKVDDMEVFRDQQVGNNQIFIHCKEEVKIHISLPLGPDGARGKKGKPRLITSEVKHVYKVPMSMTWNIRPTMRSCEARGHNFY